MVSRIVLAVAMFTFALAAFVVFVEFASHAITGADRDDRLFGSMIAIGAFGLTMLFLAGGLRAAGV